MKNVASYPIAEGAELDYREFASRELPTDLREEIALLRTFLKNAMDGIRMRREDEVQEGVDALTGTLVQTLRDLGASPLHIETIKAAYAMKVRPDVVKFMRWSLDAKTLAAIRSSITAIASTAERMERIQRGRKIKVALDLAVLTWLIRTFVVPFVPRDKRGAMIALARRHGIEPGGPEVEVEDAAA